MDGMGRFLRVLFGEDEGGSGSVFPHPAKEVNLTKHFRITYLLELGGGNSNIFLCSPRKLASCFQSQGANFRYLKAVADHYCPAPIRWRQASADFCCWVG